jgi:hypothetical protein
MATIKNDVTTNGKWLVRFVDGLGEDAEKLCDSHAEAQTLANVESANQVKYYEDQHRNGLSFRKWLKKHSGS